MNVRLSIFAFVLSCGTGSQLAHANGFSGFYAPSNWTLTTNGGDGSVFLGDSPSAIRLTGNDAGGANISTDYTTFAVVSGSVSFTWDYATSDGPYYDRFGYLGGGIFTELTSRDGGEPQSGTATFNVNSGDIFGFRILSTDGCCGAGNSTISNFSAPATPVPGPLPALGLLAAFGFSRRLRARIRATRSI